MNYLHVIFQIKMKKATTDQSRFSIRQFQKTKKIDNFNNTCALAKLIQDYLKSANVFGLPMN